MNRFAKYARILLGLIFLVFGAAGLFNLLPQPENLPEKLMTFTSGLAASGYFMPFLKLTETLCGLCLVLGVAPALILVILAPISINIFLVHAFLTPGLENLIVPVLILTLHILSAKAYWRLYKPLFDSEKKIRAASGS
ncbi:MAG: acyltransferase [Bdellovibrionales bacterium]